eukprot:g2772.t1
MMQAICRGFLVRRWIRFLRTQHHDEIHNQSARVIQTRAMKMHTKKRIRLKRMQVRRKNATDIQRVYRGWRGRMFVKAFIAAFLDVKREIRAAIKIQSVFRQRRAQLRLRSGVAAFSVGGDDKVTSQKAAAQMLQGRCRIYLARKKSNSMRETRRRNTAAVKIQSNARGAIERTNIYHRRMEEERKAREAKAKADAEHERLRKEVALREMEAARQQKIEMERKMKIAQEKNELEARIREETAREAAENAASNIAQQVNTSMLHLLVRIETDVKNEVDANDDSALESPAIADEVANVLSSSARSVDDAAGGEEDAPTDTSKEAFATKCVDEVTTKEKEIQNTKKTAEIDERSKNDSIESIASLPDERDSSSRAKSEAAIAIQTIVRRKLAWNRTAQLRQKRVDELRERQFAKRGPRMRMKRPLQSFAL